MARQIIEFARASKRLKSYEKIEEILKLLDSSVENLEVETPYGKCSMSCLTVKHKKNMVKKRKLYMFHTYRYRTTAMTNKFILNIYLPVSIEVILDVAILVLPWLLQQKSGKTN
jgi:hypothetical protein